jgi:5-methylcytosine-specific restriction endonuclease McrA
MRRYICRHVGCAATIDHRGYCGRHAAEHEYGVGPTHRPRSPWRAWYQSARWKALRTEIVRRDQCCVVCGKETTLEVDHIRPHRGDEALFFDETNLQTLCKRCHSQKTSIELQQRRRDHVAERG